MKKNYDFAGWVTKNDIKCADGVVIKHDAFKDNHEKKVPLIWNHDHSEPSNVLGHVMLHNVDGGVYGHGHFNDSEEAKHAKTMIQHGDINAMSIGANKIKRVGQDVIHGMIYEVSLVLAGANPGALIEDVIAHGEDSEPGAVIYPGFLIHSADDVLSDEGGSTMDQTEENTNNTELTVGEVLETLNDVQMAAVETLIANIDVAEDEDEDEDETTNTQEDGAEMKQNAFAANNNDSLQHGIDTAAVFADIKTSSLKEGMLQHGINNIEVLFPEAKAATTTPVFYKDANTATSQILAGVKKSPLSKVKTWYADLTDDKARALGYIKGDEKVEEFFDLFTRETGPQTVYKKQKLDRDDIIDITDFDVVSWMNSEMRMMLEEELARAILVGDGREKSSKHKIKEDKIRPIISDDQMYTIQKQAKGVDNVLETIIMSLSEYKGSGAPKLYMSPTMLASLKLLKDNDGRFLFGDIPTTESIASRLGVSGIVETSFFAGKHLDKMVLVNLNDYTVGSAKGGQLTSFDDFDIDFNQYKYLIETRLCGALTMPKSAICITVDKSAAPKPENNKG